MSSYDNVSYRFWDFINKDYVLCSNLIDEVIIKWIMISWKYSMSYNFVRNFLFHAFICNHIINNKVDLLWLLNFHRWKATLIKIKTIVSILYSEQYCWKIVSSIHHHPQLYCCARLSMKYSYMYSLVCVSHRYCRLRCKELSYCSNREGNHDLTTFSSYLCNIWKNEILWFFMQLHWFCIEWSWLMMSHASKKSCFSRWGH